MSYVSEDSDRRIIYVQLRGVSWPFVDKRLNQAQGNILYVVIWVSVTACDCVWTFICTSRFHDVFVSASVSLFVLAGCYKGACVWARHDITGRACHVVFSSVIMACNSVASLAWQWQTCPGPSRPSWWSNVITVDWVTIMKQHGFISGATKATRYFCHRPTAQLATHAIILAIEKPIEMPSLGRQKQVITGWPVEDCSCCHPCC